MDFVGTGITISTFISARNHAAMNQRQGLIIAIVVVLVAVLGYYYWTKRKSSGTASSTSGSASTTSGAAARTAVMSGFNYAGCDGNYKWTGDFSSGHLLFQTGDKLAKDQVSRIATVRKDGVVTCYAPGDFTVPFGNATIGAKGFDFKYDSSLWNQQTTAPSVNSYSI
jgi:hypothetical protein